MNSAHWHLILTHVPVVGMVLATLLLAAAWRIPNDAVKRLALGVVVAMALLALPTYFTGERAEDVVERLPGVSASAIDLHEDAAGYALAAIGVAGIVALAGLALSARVSGLLGRFVAGTLVLAVLSAGVLAWTANLGGRIRHPEVQSKLLVSPGDPTPRIERPAGTREHGDDRD